MQMDPSKRYSASQALLHPFFKSLLEQDQKLKEELLAEAPPVRSNLDQEKAKPEKTKINSQIVVKKNKQIFFPKNQCKNKNEP